MSQPGSSRGAIDWNSFSIGNGNRVRFDNGTGATLNRVTGGNPSAILGTLSASGSVYLINPQGILIGRSGVISTGGRFVGSTLNTCDCAFMQALLLALTGTSNASVIRDRPGSGHLLPQKRGHPLIEPLSYPALARHPGASLAGSRAQSDSNSRDSFSHCRLRRCL
ncbi:two-partner secretion domain-containing protein [Paraburkholderia sediminicola]|uniref:two-partner secretion domain-containing protein n=1 Tax=Paraburkholderia sediminicola TaxID=458836 RepID=UPI0038B86151